MFVIVGLGNPGAEYHNTRHNAGFDAIDLLADELDIDINKNKFKAMIGEGFYKGRKVVLIKPMTYMNLSGETVVQAINFLKPREEEFIVAYDDISLKVGAIRLRKKGSAGGHNGIKSIISLTGSDEFQRIKIGVGAPRGNLVTHVLGKVSKEDEEEYVKGLVMAKDAMKAIMDYGVDKAMNLYNSSEKEKIKEIRDKKEKYKDAEVKTDEA